MGEPDSDRLQHVDEGPLAPSVLGPRPETVAGVDHDRHSREPAGDASHDPGLRVVGVQDVQMQSTNGPEQLEAGLEILAWGPGTGQAGNGHMSHATSLDARHVGASGVDAEDLVPRRDVHLELGSEQKVQAHVDAREVRDAQGMILRCPLRIGAHNARSCQAVTGSPNVARRRAPSSSAMSAVGRPWSLPYRTTSASRSFCLEQGLSASPRPSIGGLD